MNTANECSLSRVDYQQTVIFVFYYELNKKDITSVLAIALIIFPMPIAAYVVTCHTDIMSYFVYSTKKKRSIYQKSHEGTLVVDKFTYTRGTGDLVCSK